MIFIHSSIQNAYCDDDVKFVETEKEKKESFGLFLICLPFCKYNTCKCVTFSILFIYLYQQFKDRIMILEGVVKCGMIAAVLPTFVF